MHPLEDYFDAEGDELPPSAHPYGWVPIGPGELKATVRPSSGHMQTKSATVLPLEYYDNPEMELVAPEKKLEEVGLGRVGMGREGSSIWPPGIGGGWRRGAGSEEESRRGQRRRSRSELFVQKGWSAGSRSVGALAREAIA